MNRRPRWQQALRRLAIALHLAGGLVIALAWFPLIGPAHRKKLKQCWSARLLSILGLRLDIQGEILPGGLIVANHVSWIDIYAINAMAPSVFVAKSEIASWPVIGWLAKKSDTVFIERGSHRHAQHVAHDMAQRLKAGETLALFPEGTTTEGDCLLPFHAALFQPAIAAEVAVQPLVIRYRDASGQRSAAPAYAGDTTFGECLAATLAETGLVIEVICLPPIISIGQARRQLAARCAAAIGEVLER